MTVPFTLPKTPSFEQLLKQFSRPSQFEFMYPSSQTITSLLTEYFRCASVTADISVEDGLSKEDGYFSLDGMVCYGKLAGARPAVAPNLSLPLASAEINAEKGKASLPFDPVQVVNNLRLEKYRRQDSASGGALVRKAYYTVRPLMPVGVRKHLQKWSLRKWDHIPFPHWPVDRTVDQIHASLLRLALRAGDKTKLPFIWFWPEGHSSCISITHDVETSAGRDFCCQLMEINDFYGVKTSFQIIPEGRYEVPATLLDEIRRRDFEVNVHDLNHDGQLFFKGFEQFQERVKKINRYGKQFDARGFRSAVLYRKQQWMDHLEFAYDMSVPNVAHLDPQRGGCCTVMPYFLGDLVEIPVTATQDYSLFHILGEFTTKLWEQQMAIIDRAHGLANFIIHPDYVIEERARHTYEALLKLVVEARSNRNAWVAKPAEICKWWKARSRMRLVPSHDGWRIEGEGSDRARVAFARLVDNELAFQVQQDLPCGVPA